MSIPRQKPRRTPGEDGSISGWFVVAVAAASPEGESVSSDGSGSAPAWRVKLAAGFDGHVRHRRTALGD